MTQRQARRGEYAVPSNARDSRCRSCGAEIYWTTSDKGRPVPLSDATIEEGEDGQRYALVHWDDCPHADEHRRAGTDNSSLSDVGIFPLTMVFPPGVMVPVFCAYSHLWENGDLTVTFADREQLAECVFVSRLARELGLTGWVVERGSIVRVDMV